MAAKKRVPLTDIQKEFQKEVLEASKRKYEKRFGEPWKSWKFPKTESLKAEQERVKEARMLLARALSQFQEQESSLREFIARAPKAYLSHRIERVPGIRRASNPVNTSFPAQVAESALKELESLRRQWEQHVMNVEAQPTEPGLDMTLFVRRMRVLNIPPRKKSKRARSQPSSDPQPCQLTAPEMALIAILSKVYPVPPHKEARFDQSDVKKAIKKAERAVIAAIHRVEEAASKTTQTGA